MGSNTSGARHFGFDEQVPFEMDREYLRPLFAFVTSRHTDQDNDMYDRWKDYHK